MYLNAIKISYLNITIIWQIILVLLLTENIDGAFLKRKKMEWNPTFERYGRVRGVNMKNGLDSSIQIGVLFWKSFCVKKGDSLPLKSILFYTANVESMGAINDVTSSSSSPLIR